MWTSPFGTGRRGDPGQAFQQAGEPRRARDAALHDLAELGELGDRHRALQLAHAVVERQEVVVGLRVAVAPGLVDEQEHPAGERGVVGDDHAALAGGDVLALLEAEAADGAERADLAAAVLGQKAWAQSSMTGMPLESASSMIAVMSHGIAEEVGDDDRLGAVAEAGLDGLRRHVAGDRVDVGEDRDGALVEDRGQGAHVGDRRRDDLVAGLRVDGRDRGVDRRRAGGAGVGVLDAPSHSAKRVSSSLTKRPWAVSVPVAMAAASSVDLLLAEGPAGGVLVGGQCIFCGGRLRFGHGANLLD